jgi:hypothetical protein
MATNLPTLDAGYHFIQGVSRVAYDELARFSLWRQANDYSARPLTAAPAVAPAADLPATSTEPDLQMWAPKNPPVNALPLNPAAPPAADNSPAT